MNINKMIDLVGEAKPTLDRADSVFCEASASYESDLPQDRPSDERYWHRHYANLHHVTGSQLTQLEGQLEMISGSLEQVKKQGLDFKALDNVLEETKDAN